MYTGESALNQVKEQENTWTGHKLRAKQMKQTRNS